MLTAYYYSFGMFLFYHHNARYGILELMYVGIYSCWYQIKYILGGGNTVIFYQELSIKCC